MLGKNNIGLLLFCSSRLEDVCMAKEQKSARELAKLLSEFSPGLKDVRFSIIADQGHHDWRVQLDECSDSDSAVGKELERAWAHLAYEYELKM
jgi:hypothetical protein